EGGQEERIRKTDSPLETQSGILEATVEALNSLYGDYIDELDDVASALIRSVNEIHTQGQGRKGFDEVTSAYSADTGVPLVSAGLPFTPSNGSFDVQVVDDDNDLISTQRIQVRRLGQIGDSTVQSIVQDLNAIDGIDASITSDGRVHLESSSPSSSFTFSDDTSGFLASVGLNTFFVGEDAGNIEVNSVIRQDSSYLSVSKTGIGQDTDALIDLVDLVDRPLDHLDGRSVRGVYEQTVNELGQKISLQKSTTEAQRNFYATLQSQHLATTGVNLDEEAIKMIAYQRAFQASSRVITTANEMLDILVNL
ncbi:MAG: flagellar basal body rod C-terminal domain-containing protein, partial [Planctomycetota bacterium]